MKRYSSVKEGVIVPLKTFLRENPASEGKPLFWAHKERKFLKYAAVGKKSAYVWLKGEIEA